jgi:hypothetical protein
LRAVAVIDHHVGDRLHGVSEQAGQHRQVLRQIAVAVTQVEVFLRIVSGAVRARERGRRQPDQIETAVTDGWRLLRDDPVPALGAVAREFLRMAVPIGLPVEPLQHDAVVLEAGLRAHRLGTERDRDRQQRNDG